MKWSLVRVRRALGHRRMRARRGVLSGVDATEVAVADPVPRERPIAPWYGYMAQDQLSLARLTLVWEIATVQWGFPAGVFIGGVALTSVASKRDLSLAAAAAIFLTAGLGVMAVAYGVGRLLWALGLRPRRHQRERVGRGVG